MGNVVSLFKKHANKTETRSMFITAMPDHTAQFSNPVINRDFPDPNCIKIKDVFYAFATNFGEFQADKSHIQTATSSDLVQWNLRPDALPDLPSWARPGRTWAPNITHVQTEAGDTYVLYFAAWDIQTDLQGLAVATSKNPEGPYRCTAPRPFILQEDAGGTIDPSVFTDNQGKRWLLFKNDGNRVGKPTYIYLCPLTPDATQLAGKAQVVISNDQSWEGPVVEAPFMWQQDAKYYLFYSGNGYVTPEYAVGYAVADRPEGPYRKSPDPVLKSVGPVIGPGACCVVAGPHGSTWMLYHSWDSSHTFRAMSIARMTWNGGKPQVDASWGKNEAAPFQNSPAAS